MRVGHGKAVGILVFSSKKLFISLIGGFDVFFSLCNYHITLY